MSDHLTPVQVCLRLIGPLPELERIVGYRPKSSYGWLRNSSDRDPGDLPSTRLQKRLHAHAAAHGIPLTANHLIWGASATEIEALLAKAPEFASSRHVPEAAE